VRRAAVAVLLLAAAGAAAAVVVLTHRGHDVVGSPTVEFVPTQPVAPRPPPGGGLAWSMYGLDPRRTRSVAGVRFVRPLRRLWTFHGKALLEFPPAAVGGRLYLPTFDGRFFALDARTGRALWRFRAGRCSWASPAVARGLVYDTFLSATDCHGERYRSGGELIAFDARSGRIRWRRSIPPSESSPLLLGPSVIVGDSDGDVSAFAAATGRRIWSTRLGGAVKGSVAAAGGRLFVGAYDGRVYALAARTGRVVWRASAQPELLRDTQFYSSPAVAYGRVYLGGTDGVVYSLGAVSGRLRWARHTGGYVYASPAVWHRTVYVGSYDHWFYALDAATGAVRWRFHANGPISGAASVLGGTVWFSTFAGRTYALDARSGRVRWTFPDGKYSPAVTDGRRLYLVGLGRLYAFTAG
jgi:outer membrane protein assembly factor BamB